MSEQADGKTDERNLGRQAGQLILDSLSKSLDTAFGAVKAQHESELASLRERIAELEREGSVLNLWC